MTRYKYCTVLTISGSDSSGGAGIQADLKTFAALGCYGTSAITAVTAQNTLGVTAIHTIPPAMIKNQIIAVMDDIAPAAIKIGMLPDADAVNIVAETLKPYGHIPVILDPVIRSTSGKQLASVAALQAMKQELFPIATLITPNLDEAAQLTGHHISSLEDMQAAAQALLYFGSSAVLVKGGHLNSLELFNVYADQAGATATFSYPHIASLNTHGTGCTFASAIAASLARGQSLRDAIATSGRYVHIAIKEGRNVRTGKGCGPLNHLFKPRQLAKVSPSA